MKYLILFFLPTSLFAHSLKVQGPRRIYNFETTEKSFHLIGDGIDLSFVSKPCNSKMIGSFLADFERAVIRAPKHVQSRKIEPALVYVLNGKSFMALKESSLERNLAKLPEEVIKMKLIESQMCGK